MAESIIKVEQLNKNFIVGNQELHILKDINLEIEKDDFAIILGPSGCGKSTLLHSIIGLEPPSSGKVVFSGVDLYTGRNDDFRSIFRKSHIGMIYQQPNWVKALKVVDNVALPLELLGESKESSNKKALSALASVSMDEWADYLPTSLSSGQQQRIALARALITDPEVIIADEPTGNLDFEAGQALMNLLKIYNSHFKKTIIMVTHDLEYLSFAKTAIKLFDGKLVGIYRDTDKEHLQEETKGKKVADIALPEAKLNLSTISQKKAKISEYEKSKEIANSDTGLFKKQTLEKVTILPNAKKARISPINRIKELIKKTPSFLRFMFILSKQIAVIVILLTQFLISLILNTFVLRFIPKSITRILETPITHFKGIIKRVIDPSFAQTIDKEELIRIAVKNMMAKRTRTLVTIGGMAVGIAAIVFLVSLGYGLQDVVISRVARLDEMKQAEVSPQAGGKVSLNDETISSFSKLQNVSMLLPLISVVGKINYLNSVTDVAAYGVTSDYLQQSAIKPIDGKIFDSNETVVSVNTQSPEYKGNIAGVATEKFSYKVGEKISDVDFNINQNIWAAVRSGPDLKSEILGYTKRIEGLLQGSEVWGVEDNWVKSNYLIWNESNCSSLYDLDCYDDRFLMKKDSSNLQVYQEGYIYNADLQISARRMVAESTNPKVLGIDNQDNIDFQLEGSVLSESDQNWVELPQLSENTNLENIKTIELSTIAKKQAVVNIAMLKVMGIEPSEAIGKTFGVSYVVTGNLVNEDNEKIESAIADYSIVGIIPEDKTPYFYIPFIDLRSLGITNYSQIKLVVNDPANLSTVRTQVESLGYNTVSVSDTVSQIESLFSTLRTLLALVGSVALAVASLGMFNTLTVSLLERTREVGFLKALGMTSSEVQELFLTESLTMMFFGGFAGILGGILIGKFIGLVITLLATGDNSGYIDVSRLPFSFLLIVGGLALFVGIATGIYPAMRAKKISALNALRYE